MPPLLLDVATLLVSAIVTLGLCCAVLAALWRQHDYQGPGYWLACFVMQVLALLLFGLRSHIPDGLSILGAGVMMAGGVALLHVGLARYFGQASSWPRLLGIFLLFAAVHAWFTFASPSLFARNLNITITLMALCSHSAWLTWRHAPARLRPESTLVAGVLAAMVVLGLVRIIYALEVVDPATDIFRQGTAAKLALLAYQVCAMAMTVSLLLMINRALLGSMENELAERRQSEAALRLSEERLTRAEMATKAGNWELHLDSKTMVASQGAGAVYGVQPHLLDLEAIRTVPLENYRPVIDAALAALVNEGAPYDIEFKIRSLDTGEIKDIQSQATYDANRRTIFGVISDITARKQAEVKLELAASVFRNAREGIVITDPLSRIVDVNASFTRITGYDKADVLGKTPNVLSSGRQSRDFFQLLWQTLNEHGYWHGEVWNRRKDGSLYVEQLTISEVRNAQGVITNYVGLFNDITMLKNHQHELERMAHYDVLTGLPNRKLLADRLSMAIAQSSRRLGSLAVVFLDLDGFKAVNDQHGHAVGDALLIEVARRLKAVLREGDTLARVGGDEFIAVLVDLESRAICETVLQRLLVAAAEPVVVDSVRAMVSTSIGYTLYPDDDADADLLIRHADQAMYKAKQAGKNRYALFTA